MDERFAKLLVRDEYTLPFEGGDLVVHRGVFAPDPNLSQSTFMLLEHLPDLSGKSCLDIGSGTGILSVYAARHGALQVVACDVSNAAILNTRENVRCYGLEATIDVRMSDLFQDVPESFDVICANLPILDERWGYVSGFAHQIIGRFLHELSAHLKSGGVALLPWGSFADITPLREELARLPSSVREWNEERMGYTWTLFEISL